MAASGGFPAALLLPKVKKLQHFLAPGPNDVPLVRQADILLVGADFLAHAAVLRPPLLLLQHGLQLRVEDVFLQEPVLLQKFVALDEVLLGRVPPKLLDWMEATRLFKGVVHSGLCHQLLNLLLGLQLPGCFFGLAEQLHAQPLDAVNSILLGEGRLNQAVAPHEASRHFDVHVAGEHLVEVAEVVEVASCSLDHAGHFEFRVDHFEVGNLADEHEDVRLYFFSLVAEREPQRRFQTRCAYLEALLGALGHFACNLHVSVGESVGDARGEHLVHVEEHVLNVALLAFQLELEPASVLS